ncbi:CD3e molecule%2C epsilon associated protein [Xyrichtys novacula]|nr:CD3e molecule%2C epsilon associated protein [Xyrichtys novacula]
MKVPLSGLRTMKVRVAAGGEQTRSSKQIYSVLASTHASSDLCLLTSDKQESGRAAFGPAFCGVLNICESYGDSSTNQAPQVIPATPAPSIPPGLRQRFHPFGSRTPTLTCKAKREADGQAEEDEGQTKKKKRKKEKGVKAERADEEEVKIKEEPVAETQEELMMEVSDAVEEKRKKKKKKKDREREEEGVEHSMMVNMEEITVKSEPVDTLYGDVVDGSGKKKKKKKKNKTDDD